MVVKQFADFLSELEVGSFDFWKVGLIPGLNGCWPSPALLPGVGMGSGGEGTAGTRIWHQMWR